MASIIYTFLMHSICCMLVKACTGTRLGGRGEENDALTKFHAPIPLPPHKLTLRLNYQKNVLELKKIK